MATYAADRGGGTVADRTPSRRRQGAEKAEAIRSDRPECVRMDLIVVRKGS
jgi:hypothetical protein